MTNKEKFYLQGIKYDIQELKTLINEIKEEIINSKKDEEIIGSK